MADQILSEVRIDARSRRIEIIGMEQGKGRHRSYGALKQAPPELRGAALELIRNALIAAGYSSLSELDETLTSEPVTPAEDDEDE